MLFLGEMMDKTKLETKLTAIFSLLAIAAVSIFAMCSYTVDSELWSVVQAKDFGRFDHFEYSVYNKPVFYFFLRLLYFLPLGNLQHVLAAKFLFVCNFWALSYVCFQLFKRVAGDTKIAWLGLLFLSCHPTWMSESFRIRSDLLAMTFSLAALVNFLSYCDSGKRKQLLWMWVCFALSLLSTPKAIVWDLPILTFVLLSGRLKITRGNLVVSAAVVLFLGFSFAALIRWNEFIGHAYDVAWEHFAESMREYSFASAQYKSLDWLFVLNSVYSTPFLWLLLGLGLLLLPWTIRQNPCVSSRPILLSYGLLAICFIIYTPKLAFFWGALVPFWTIPAVLLCKRIFSDVRISFQKLLLLIPVLIVSNGGLWSYRLFKEQNGFSIYNLITDFDTYIGDQSFSMFDSMGLLPRGNVFMAYVGPGDVIGSQSGVNRVIAEKPDIIFETARIKAFSPEISYLILESQYIEVQKGIWLKKETFGDAPKPITQIENTSFLFAQRLLWIPTR